jgi:hypothetical protein
MQRMKRISLAVAAVILTVGALPGLASAQELEIGVTTSPVVAPVCPTGVSAKKCTIVLDEVTALESIRDGVAYPTAVKKAGEIVAFTLGISAISSNKAALTTDYNYLSSSYGGPPEAELTVLRSVGVKTATRWVVAAQTLPYPLQPYLGQVVQFPLIQPLPVVPGEVLGITIPTWAPLLSIDLTASQFAYRQSRTSKCDTYGALELAQLTIGDQSGYSCNYPGTRIEYSASEVTSPTPNKST